MSEPSPQEIVECVLGAATTDATVVAVNDGHVVNFRWAVSTPTTNGNAYSQDVTVTAIAEVAGGRGWSAGTRSGPVQQWASLLAAAESDAVAGEAASEGCDLPVAAVRADFHDVPAAAPHPALPVGLEDAFGTTDAELFGYAEQLVQTTYVGTSTGSRWRTEERAGRFEISGKASQRARSAWFGAAADDLADIDARAGLADIDRGLRSQLTRIEVPAQPTTVILSPSAVADLMIVLWWSAVARDAAEGHSPFTGTGPAGTALGMRLTERDLSLTSDPTIPGVACPDLLWTPGSSAAATVFDTGSGIEAVEWIDSGCLSALAATRAASGDYDLPFVASAENLLLTDADGWGTLADVIARTERALLVTSLWYIRDVDPQSMLVTGLTRDGTYVVEHGRIIGAAGNYRFNDSPLHLLARIVDAGRPERCLPREWGDYFTRTVMPTLVVDDFGLSTPSAAI